MLKKILLALIFVISAISTIAHAEDDMKTAASKAYVDTKIETKQLKIPAAGQPNVGAGETVMTYTSTGNGEIGERGLYSDISSYNATTDGDKLITASALNATFTNLPTTPTTKLECANQNDGCTLWTIVDQTAYNGARNLFDASLVENRNYYIYDSNGSIQTPTNGTFRASDYIPVVERQTYYFGITPFSSANAGLAWYSDRSPSAYISGSNGRAQINNNMKMVAPVGAKYIRFSFRIDDGYDTNWQNTVYMCDVINGVPVLSEWKPY